MNEVLLETMVEKLDKLTESNQQLVAKIDLIPDYRREFTEMNEQLLMLQTDIKSKFAKILKSGEEIMEQRTALKTLTDQLKSPLHQKVKHVHYLDNPLVCCIVLVGIVVLLIVWIGQLYEYIHVREKNQFYHFLMMPADTLTKPNSHNIKRKEINSKMNSKKTHKEGNHAIAADH